MGHLRKGAPCLMAYPERQGNNPAQNMAMSHVRYILHITVGFTVGLVFFGYRYIVFGDLRFETDCPHIFNPVVIFFGAVGAD